MNTRTAAGVAAAITLTVAAASSAFALNVHSNDAKPLRQVGTFQPVSYTVVPAAGAAVAGARLAGPDGAAGEPGNDTSTVAGDTDVTTADALAAEAVATTVALTATGPASSVGAPPPAATAGRPARHNSNDGPAGSGGPRTSRDGDHDSDD
jgi:hypothetical protein